MAEALDRLGARGRLRAAWERLRIWAAVVRPSVDIRDRMQLRQVASLLRQTNVMGVTNLVNSALVAIVLWDDAPKLYLLGWAGLIWLIWVAIFIRRFRRRNATPPKQVRSRTISRAVLRATFVGGCVGCGGFPAAHWQHAASSFDRDLRDRRHDGRRRGRDVDLSGGVLRLHCRKPAAACGELFDCWQCDIACHWPRWWRSTPPA